MSLSDRRRSCWRQEVDTNKAESKEIDDRSVTRKKERKKIIKLLVKKHGRYCVCCQGNKYTEDALISGDRGELEKLIGCWSMLGRISAQTFSFDQSFYPYNSERFALCFFRDPNVVSSLRKMETGAWVPLEKPAVSVDVEVVPCTKVSMELFDPIYSCGVLRPSGHVVKCFHDVYPDYDELRQMLQEEDSEHYHVIGRAERGEFLLRLFKHLCLGGELCQYEDTIDPYISTTKHIYKDLISVQKDPETKKISVVSTVLKVSAQDESGRCYPGRWDEEQTFAYMIVDPYKRHVTLLYHSYGVGSVTF